MLLSMVPVSSPQRCWQEGSTSCSSSLVRLPVLQKMCWCFSSLFRSLTWLSIKLAQLPGTLWVQQQSLALDLYSEAKQEEHKAESSSLFPSVLKSRCQDPLVKYLSVSFCCSCQVLQCDTKSQSHVSAGDSCSYCLSHAVQ